MPNGRVSEYDMKSEGKLKSRLIGLSLWLMLLVGAGMIAAPWVNARMEEKEQLQLLEDWSKQLQATAAAKPVNAVKQLSAGAGPSENALPQWRMVDDYELLGSIRIEAIDLEEPIVKGADAKALKRGAGTVLEGAMPGQPGNFVLAGHRGWSKGRYFNRLDELEAGDVIDLDTTAGTIRYKVTEKTVVEPDDLSVLKSGESAYTLTLITCHPKKTHTHRLIVKAELDMSMKE